MARGAARERDEAARMLISDEIGRRRAAGQPIRADR
jgi:hypothetical protein